MTGRPRTWPPGGRRRAGRRISLLVSATAAVATALGVLASSAGPVASQEEPGNGLDLITQTFAVAADGVARFEFVVVSDVPEITPTTTIPTTTTPTTTTTIAPTTTTVSSTTPPATPSALAAATPPSARGSAAFAGSGQEPDLTVEVRAHPLIERRADVDAALRGDLGAVTDLAAFPLADVARTDDETGADLLELEVPIGSGSRSALDLGRAGLYPITIVILRDQQVVVGHTTFLERLPDDGSGRGPLSLAVLAGVDDIGPEPTEQQLIEARPLLTEIAALAETVDAPITVSIPPVYTRTILADDEALAGRLQTALAREAMLSMPVDPLEPSSAVAAGIGDDFARWYNEGENELTATFPATIRRRSVWLVTQPLTTDGAAALRDVGVQLLVHQFDGPLRADTVGDDLAYTSLLTRTELPDGADVATVVVDPMMWLLDPDRVTGSTPADDAVHLMATISALRYELAPDQRSLVLTTPSMGVPDADVLTVLEQFVAEQPEVSFQPMAAVPGLTNDAVDERGTVGSEVAALPPVPLGERADRVRAGRLRSVDADSMLQPADSLLDRWQSELDTSLSTGLAEPRAMARIDGVDAETDAVRDQVQPPESFEFTVTGRDTTIPLRITNNGPTTLTIAVHLEAEKLAFPDGDIVVDLDPNGTTEVPVPVTARSNGQFPVLVELRTPLGNALTEPVELTARVTSLAGIGRVVTVAGVLVLATWWFSYFRKRRRSERAAAVAASLERHPANGALADASAGREVSPDAAEARIPRVVPHATPDE